MVRAPKLQGDETEEERTAIAAYAKLLARVEAPRVPSETGEDYTAVDRYRIEASDTTKLSRAVMDTLKAKLREAEAREERRLAKTPKLGLQRPAQDTPVEDSLEIDIEVEEPTYFDPDLDPSTLPKVVVALAPNSDSHFYGGFDETNPDGVFVATHHLLDLGAPIRVEMLLPGGYEIHASAVVEFVRPPEAAHEGAPTGYGVRLCELDVSMRRLIAVFCKHRPPYFYVG